MSYIPPDYNCPLCPRLAGFREDNKAAYPDFFNGPVPSFGALDAPLLVVGLAPGLKGANRTGRPFTGDYAGLILYSALQKSGFAKGNYEPEKVAVAGRKNHPPANHNADGFSLIDCRISNGVRCVPQANKPEPSEIKTCNRFLVPEMAAMRNLRVVITLGLIAHKAVLMALGLKQSAFKFGHGATHKLPDFILLNSYHCSRYNINTGVLTQAMFDEVVQKAQSLIK